jgi:hypothetical protein
MNVEIGSEVAQFPEKEYINEIIVAVRVLHPLFNPLEPECHNHLVKGLGEVLAV